MLAFPYPMTWPYADLWDQAWTFEEFLARAAPPHRELWHAVHRLARVPEWAVVEARALPAIRLVVLTEDWCGDAVNTVPVLAKWAAAADIPLRVLRRDAHPDVMDRYLTNGTARSIPVVIVLTEAMDELGWWGPRPRALQEWVVEQRQAGRDKKDLYPEIRRWYAKDKGETTLREVLAVAAGAPHTEAVPSA